MEKIPAGLKKALAAHPKAKAAWADLTPIARRDFVTWIESAKKPETRLRRIEKACDMLAKGKRRPCCYVVVPMSLYKALGEDAKAKAGWQTLSPDERRDFSDWVEQAKDSEERMIRVVKACAMLAAGKRRPL